MSWSVEAIGRAPAVAEKIERDFAATTAQCRGPEEGVRQSVRAALAIALAAQDPATVVQVSASGSQSSDYGTNEIRNQLSVTVRPLYNFVE